MTKPNRNEPPRWLDEPRNVTKVFYGVVILVLGWTFADFFYHKHGHFSFEEWPGFHAVYGFLGSVFLVLAAKALRRILMRDEDYYDD